MDAEAFIAARLSWMDPRWEEYPRERARVIEQVTERRRRIATWEDELLSHAAHPTFQCYGSAVLREFGFRCGCGGAAYDRVVGLGALRFSPMVRALIQRTRRIDPPPDIALRERAMMGGNRPHFPRHVTARARAMLHQLLTREQRWSLRASRSFRVVGQDGRTYEIAEGERVRLIEGGQATISYCIHPIQMLPPHDVMIGQKLLLETNIEHFLAIAIARDIRPFTIRLEEALAPIAAA